MTEDHTTDIVTGATPKQGYADLMRLADHLDRSVGMLKSGKTPA